MKKIIAILLCLTAFSAVAMKPAELLEKHHDQFPKNLSDQEKESVAKYTGPLIRGRMSGVDVKGIIEGSVANFE